MLVAWWVGEERGATFLQGAMHSVCSTVSCVHIVKLMFFAHIHACSCKKLFFIRISACMRTIILHRDKQQPLSSSVSSPVERRGLCIRQTNLSARPLSGSALLLVNVKCGRGPA